MSDAQDRTRQTRPDEEIPPPSVQTPANLDAQLRFGALQAILDRENSNTHWQRLFTGMDWTPQEKQVFDRLGSPVRIQHFLDGLAYNTSDRVYSPREVLQRRQAHCLDGALFAAVALQQLGHPPLLMDLRAVNDDDHVVAVYRDNGLWGAVAKSNTTLLRYRDPIYRTLRELALSYFPMYFNSAGEMSLREYSRPFSLRRFGPEWVYSKKDMSFIGEALDTTRHYSLLTRQQLRGLPRVQSYLLDACFLGADKNGLYKVS